MPKSMPSPKGTNHAGHFVRNSFPTPTPGAAYDAEAGLNDDIRSKITDLLQGKVDDDTLTQLLTIVAGGDMAQDEPEEFAGKPTDPADNTKLLQDRVRTQNSGFSYSDAAAAYQAQKR